MHAYTYIVHVERMGLHAWESLRNASAYRLVFEEAY